MNVQPDTLLSWIKQDHYLYSAYHYIQLNMKNQEDALRFMYDLYIHPSPILLNGYQEFLLNEKKS
ncbi:hypothetical protein [Alkalicoccobacillus gibsonii]|jgi:hypothetical protein|uniref:hypothetical protein n=1 Tax=Alkalicoccobacillus gibsonii TaxID=79881 RepID=UPI003512A207